MFVVQEARVLNRVLRCTNEGWEYEADQRHAELLIAAMSLEQAKAVSTAGETVIKEWEELDLPLEPKQHQLFRAAAARANYLAADRPDLGFAVKEICRGMSAPESRHLRMLKRLCRFLVGKPRLIWQFHWQSRAAARFTAYSDSDWAGCRRTARSTTGGVLMRGSHCVRSFSVTQKRVTLSSAEAELCAAVKVAAELIGIVQLAEGLGMADRAGDASVGSVFVDSSAALGVISRRGNGKLRHIRVGQLWVQQLSEDGDVKFAKVAGSESPADLLTKNLAVAGVNSILNFLNMRHEGGRATSGLALQ